MVMFKLLVKPLKNHFGYFKLLKYLQRKISSLIPRKFQHVTYDIFDVLAKPHALKIKKNHQTPSKPCLPFSKFEQLCTAKHVQMLSNLVHMLKWCNNASIPNGTGWRRGNLGQSASKPSLTRIKFESLCTTNFFSKTPTLVSLTM